MNKVIIDGIVNYSQRHWTEKGDGFINVITKTKKSKRIQVIGTGHAAPPTRLILKDNKKANQLLGSNVHVEGIRTPVPGTYIATLIKEL
jgi:hypothetical protein